ncbi:MAG: ATP-binding protein [Spirochaetales bacterium]|nr:ATP-binding protein [Spirochaetales bacterium]
MRHIVFQGRKYKRVVMNIRGNALFHEILKKVNDIAVPHCPCEEEHMRYALLELINNSLRAHREQKVVDNIHVEIRADVEELIIIVTDKGGGFDTKILPYDLQENASGIDTNSSRFQEYRESHGYTRFGMGLIVARKLFHRFHVTFYDEQGDVPDYHPERVVGTRIEMGIRWNNA